jgi:O-acetylserine/cysteine efflux transporter
LVTWASLLIGTVGYAGSFLLYNWALAVIGASRSNIILNLIPACGSASAFPVLGEPLTLPQAIGAALVSASIFIFPKDNR